MPRRKVRTNAEMSESTIAALVARARREFGANGYANASVDQIAAEVKLTKGAVYYHFKNKQGLFEAAVRDCQREIVKRIDAVATAAPDPVAAITRGCEAFLDVVVDAELRQIVIVDGPAVLGYTLWRKIDAEFGLGSLKEGLRAWAGKEARDIDLLAHFISGALNDLVLFVAESANPKATHRRVREQLPSILSAVLAAR
jgi:AcrR family transcriptional regulator